MAPPLFWCRASQRSEGRSTWCQLWLWRFSISCCTCAPAGKPTTDHHHTVMMSAPFSGQQRASTQSASPLVKGLRQRNGRLPGWREIDLLQQAQCFCIEIAYYFGLDAIGDHRE